MTKKHSDNTELTQQEATEAAADLTKILGLSFAANRGNAYKETGRQYPALAPIKYKTVREKENEDAKRKKRKIKNHSIYYTGNVTDAQLRLLADILPFGGFSISDGYKEVALPEGAKKKELFRRTEEDPYESREVDAKPGDTVQSAAGKAIVINRVDLEKLHARAKKIDKQRANAGEVAGLLQAFTGEPFIFNGLAIDSKQHFDSNGHHLKYARVLLSMLAEKGALRVGLQSSEIMEGDPKKPKEVTRLFIPEFDLAKIKQAIPEVLAELAALLTQATGQEWQTKKGRIFTASDGHGDSEMINKLIGDGIVGGHNEIAKLEKAEFLGIDSPIVGILPYRIKLGALKAVAAKAENAQEAATLLTQILGYEWTANGTTLSAAKPDSQDHSDCTNLYTLENGIFREFPKGVNDTSATALTIDIDQINLEKLRLRANTAKQEIHVGGDVIHAGQTGPKPKETGRVIGDQTSSKLPFGDDVSGDVG
jgi:hypothetical protein